MKRVSILLIVMLFVIPTASTGDTPRAPTKSPSPPTIEVRFIDNSIMKVAPLEEKLLVATRYGKLDIPICDIRRVELGNRIPSDLAKKIEISPKEMLELPENDVVTTDNCKVTGKLQVDELKVKTFQFGELTIKLRDVRSIRVGSSADQEADNLPVQENPGTLTNLQWEIGKTFAFRVTGRNNGSIWGTGVYTSGSDLATAAVHSGALAVGQTGVIKVEIIAPPQGFPATTQNGVTSGSHQGFFSAYRIISPSR